MRKDCTSAKLFRDTVVDEKHYNLSYSWNQDLPSEFRTIGSADYFSSFEFLQQYGETFEEATRRSKRASATVSRSWSHYDFRVLFDRNETAFDDDVALRQVLPSVRLGSRETRVGGTPLLVGFQTEAARFSRTFEGEPGDYMRLDVAPTAP